MASTRTSKEISFSRSSIRRMLMSMSTSALLHVVVGPDAGLELDLHPGAADLRVGQPPQAAVHLDGGRLVVGGHDAPGEGRSLGQVDPDQAAGVAAPVPWQRERAVDAAR